MTKMRWKSVELKGDGQEQGGVGQGKGEVGGEQGVGKGQRNSRKRRRKWEKKEKSTLATTSFKKILKPLVQLVQESYLDHLIPSYP